MIEIPESATISQQAFLLLHGKTVRKVYTATSPHRFAWYKDNPENYHTMLTGHTIESVEGHGSFIDLHFNGDCHLSISDGTHIKYSLPVESHPKKHLERSLS